MAKQCFFIFDVVKQIKYS